MSGQADHEWTRIKVEAVLVSAIIMPGEPRGIVQTIHNMGALYTNIYIMLEIRGWSEQLGLFIHIDIFMAKFLPLKQGKIPG